MDRVSRFWWVSGAAILGVFASKSLAKWLRGVIRDEVDGVVARSRVVTSGLMAGQSINLLDQPSQPLSQSPQPSWRELVNESVDLALKMYRETISPQANDVVAAVPIPREGHDGEWDAPPWVRWDTDSPIDPTDEAIPEATRPDIVGVRDFADIPGMNHPPNLLGERL